MKLLQEVLLLMQPKIINKFFKYFVEQSELFSKWFYLLDMLKKFCKTINLFLIEQDENFQ